jgi:CheY-like chemotaxis protein
MRAPLRREDMAQSGLTSYESIKRRIKKDELDMIVEASCTSPLNEDPIGHEPESVEVPFGETHLELQPEVIGGTETKPKRVLVVDDERVIADTLATILRNAGYQAVAAYDASSALSLCEAFCPELIIADVIMPITTGVTMAICAKQRHPACKILLFSGQAATANLLREARESGYDFEILLKPVNPKHLLARLAK